MKVAGYASTSDLDHYRHVVAPGTFTEAIAQKGLSGPAGIRLLFQHEAQKVLGAIEKLEQRRDGLWIEATINEEISFGSDVAAMVRSAGGLNFSVGFFLLDADIKTDPFDQREYLHITKGELTEPRLVCRRLQLLSRMEHHEQDNEQVFPRSA